MLTYRDIICALARCKSGTLVPAGTIFSFPLISKDSDDRLIDNFFLYAGPSPTDGTYEPLARVGIYAQEGSLAYYRGTQEFPFTGGPMHYHCGMSYTERRYYIKEYERLYPEVRNFALDNDLTPAQRECLQKFFQTQWVLFESQMSYYRQTAPEFYHWMITKLEGTTFVDQCLNIKLKLSQLRKFLEMAGNALDQKLLLGLRDAEFDDWQKKGDSILRTVLCCRVLGKNFSQFPSHSGPALIAARSRDGRNLAKCHSDRLDTVRQLARNLRKEYDLQLPVNLNALAEQLGIQVEYRALDTDIDGFVTMDEQGEVITINNNARRRYPARQRFTLAHEIGHVVIPWHTGTTACITDDPSAFTADASLVDLQELEANVFASELLIPSDWMRSRAAKAQQFEPLLNGIIRKTKASALACLYALENVLPAGDVVFVSSDAMKREKRFRAADTLTWRMGRQDPRKILDQIFLEKESFRMGSYSICRYRLLPCPSGEDICKAYDAAGQDLGRMLTDLTEQQPQQLLHCLSRILSLLPDTHCVFLEPVSGNSPAFCHPGKASTKIPKSVKNYDQLISWLNEAHPDYRELTLPNGQRMAWFREL